MPRGPIAASDLLAAAALALAAFAIAAGLREAGTLDRVDLAVDDALVEATAGASPGEAFFVILEREQDLARWGFPLSDEALATLLDKVAAAQPLAIAIDKYRDRPVAPGGERLDALLKGSDRIFWVAKFGADPRDAIPAPAAVAERFVGCGDLVDDPDGAVRRALMYLDQEGRVCYSLAFQLARHAALARGQEAKFTEEDPPRLVIGNARLRAIDPGHGPYAAVDTAGFQVFVPTAAGVPQVPTASLDDLMQGRVDPARLRGRIVLFGSEAQSLHDFFNIPTAEGRRKVPGVMVHALVASYLLNAASGNTRALELARPRVTLAITGAFALMMAFIACSRRRTNTVLAAGALAFLVYVIGVLISARAGVLFAPTAPAIAMALALSSGVARSAWLEARERAQLMDIFGRHVSAEVADALWEKRGDLLNKGAFVPRPLEATVLFLDIRGFTTVFEHLPPERSVPWLNRGLAAMTEAIMRHQGIVARFIGDSIMAVFGAPVPRTTQAEVAGDARNAILAALELRGVLAALNREFAAQSLPPMRVRVGINTGNMTQCSVGTERRMEFTMLGDAVNTASRLESYAMEDDGQDVRILVGERTMELAGAQFQTRLVGSILLKGKEVPVKLYQVLGAP